MERQKGTVKWYNMQKGYGFIEGEDGQDYFVHYTALPDNSDLKPDDAVTFDVVSTDRGMQAKDIKLE